MIVKAVKSICENSKSCVILVREESELFRVQVVMFRFYMDEVVKELNGKYGKRRCSGNYHSRLNSEFKLYEGRKLKVIVGKSLEMKCNTSE